MLQTLTMLVVQPITHADIPVITDLWYDGFRTSGFLELIPDTPGIRQWWNDANLHDLVHKPTARYWKVVDDTMPNGPPIAYAKWDMQSAEERGDRFPPWHGDMNDGCSEFFGRLERQRRELLGGKKNYYLDMLCTHPQYRGKGAGSMLVARGCEEADQDRVPAYVDASRDGAPLYARHGFEDRTIPGFAAEGVKSMVRQPKS